MAELNPRGRIRLLRTIAAYKITKVVLLLVAAYGWLRLRDVTLVHRIYTWTSTLPSGLEHSLLLRGLIWFTGLSATRVQALGVAALLYAGIFSVEGIGLWMGRRWAEWLTIVITASLVPFELWEIWQHLSPSKVVVFLVNMSIVWYLIVVLRATRTPPAGKTTRT